MARAISKVAPDHIRGAVMGLERTVLRAGQGLGAVLAGVFAQWLGSAALVIGIGGLWACPANLRRSTWDRSWRPPIHKRAAFASRDEPLV